MFEDLIQKKLCAFLLRKPRLRNTALLLCYCEEEKNKFRIQICSFVSNLNPAQSTGWWVTVSVNFALWQVCAGVSYRNLFNTAQLCGMGDSAISGSLKNTRTTECLGWTFVYYSRTETSQ